MDRWYIISRMPPAAFPLKQVGEIPGERVFELPNAFPRFFLAEKLRRATNMETALVQLRSPEIDLRREAVVEGVAETAGSGQVRVVRYSPREVILETVAPAPSFLVTS